MEEEFSDTALKTRRALHIPIMWGTWHPGMFISPGLFLIFEVKDEPEHTAAPPHVHFPGSQPSSRMKFHFHFFLVKLRPALIDPEVVRVMSKELCLSCGWVQ